MIIDRYSRYDMEIDLMNSKDPYNWELSSLNRQRQFYQKLYQELDHKAATKDYNVLLIHTLNELSPNKNFNEFIQLIRNERLLTKQSLQTSVMNHNSNSSENENHNISQFVSQNVSQKSVSQNVSQNEKLLSIHNNIEITHTNLSNIIITDNNINNILNNNNNNSNNKLPNILTDFHNSESQVLSNNLNPNQKLTDPSPKKSQFQSELLLNSQYNPKLNFSSKDVKKHFNGKSNKNMNEMNNSNSNKVVSKEVEEERMNREISLNKFELLIKNTNKLVNNSNKIRKKQLKIIKNEIKNTPKLEPLNLSIKLERFSAINLKLKNNNNNNNSNSNSNINDHLLFGNKNEEILNIEEKISKKLDKKVEYTRSSIEELRK